MKFPWKYILVSFAIGLLLGGSVGLYYSRDLARQWMKKSPEMFLKRLDRDLHLDEGQRSTISRILHAKHDKMIAFQDDLRKTARAEIRVLLTPDQQTHFDAITAKHDAERAKREDQ